MLHWLVNGRVLDPGKSGDRESRVTANQRIAGYLFEVLIEGAMIEHSDDFVPHCVMLIGSMKKCGVYPFFIVSYSDDQCSF